MSEYEKLKRAINKLDDCGMADPGELVTVLCAARAYLATLPKTKMVEVWPVEYAMLISDNCWTPACTAFRGAAEAESYAEYHRRHPDTYGCVRVTGPHQHEVPA